MAFVSLGPELGVIVRTQEKAPEIKKEFAVCDLLLRRLPEGTRPAMLGWMPVTALGIKADVVPCVFPDEETAAAAWKDLVSSFEKIGLPVCAVNGEGGEFTGPVLVLKEPSVEERFIGEDEENLRANHRGTIRADTEVIGRFSRVTGLRMRYCLGQYIVQPPLPPEEGTLNMFISARPPGNFRHFSQKAKEIFGCKLWSDGETRMVHGPTAWRGRLISAEGVPLFQIVGGSVYNLVLVLSDNSNTFDRSKLWEAMLSLLARDLAPAASSAEAPEAPIEEEPEDCVRAMAKKRSEDLRAKLGKLDFELGDLQRKFAEKLRERDDQAISLKALERGISEAVERSAGDFTRIRAMKDLVVLHTDREEGLMVETVPIALERDGRRYDLGPFRIHISPEGHVAVWSEAPKHPEGHHHPHIDKTSLECFGNITLAVAKYATSYRFADALEIIVRWLRSYRPETTLMPLEEFPSEPIVETPKTPKGAPREKRNHAELLPAAQAARSESPSAGDADRRRSGGKPRRLRARQDGGAEARRLGRR